MDDSLETVVAARHNILNKLYELALKGNVPAAKEFFSLTNEQVCIAENEGRDVDPVVFEPDEIPECG